MKIVASIEARMGSSRLPGKVLKNFGDETTLSLLVKRLQKSKYLNDIVIATSVSSKDDLICNWCFENNISFFRGSEDDVLDRVVSAHEKMGTDLIVEITGDCPFTDPKIVDLAVQTFLDNDYDVVTNCGNNLSWPMGMYAQVFSLEKLKWVNKNISDMVVHEHVSLYFYENPNLYDVYELIAPQNVSYPKMRIVLDYEEDFIFLTKIYESLSIKYNDFFGINDIVNLLESQPELLSINKHCREKETR